MILAFRKTLSARLLAKSFVCGKAIYTMALSVISFREKTVKSRNQM